MNNTDNEITECLLKAAENAFRSLTEQHREKFYYFTFVMPELSPPCISAMSEEALAGMTEKYADAPEYIRWDCTQSPYFAYGYDEYWGDVTKLFEQRFDNELHGGSDRAYETEYMHWTITAVYPD